MTLELFLRYVHFVSIFAIVGALVAEHLLLKKVLTRAEISRLATIDSVYGVAALALLSAGLTLWLGGIGKPTEFYSNNWIFLIKLGLYSVIGALSAYPTIFFIKNRKGTGSDLITIPARIFWMVRVELLLLFIIPLLAGLMARGIGYFG